MRSTNPSLHSLWQQYTATRSKEARNELVEHYIPLVRAQAARLTRKFPGSIRYDEICSAGYEGLIDAVENYDPNREARFETFCGRRIYGAVMDWLRTLDMQSRMVREFEKQRRRVRERLANAFNRQPSHEEIAESMDMPMERYREMNRLSESGQHVQLSALTAGMEQSNGGEAWHRVWDVRDPHQNDPSAALARESLAEFITRGLSRDQRMVILMYYYEELTMAEIGAVLGLSESRVCQIHKEVLSQLRRLRSEQLAREELAA